MISWISILTVLLAGLTSRSSPVDSRFEESRISMACQYTIVIDGQEDKSRKQIVDEAFDEIDRIDALMSHYKPSSELSRINREAHRAPVRVGDELFDFLDLCLNYSIRSDGAFDISVGWLMKTWGFFRGEGRLPGRAELKSARDKTGYRHVHLNRDEKTVSFDVAGIELDLGGIAKGYAVDRAVDVLKRNGITSALVNGCGSTIYGLGAPSGEPAWEVQIQDPVDQRKFAAGIKLNNRALSVSGSYEKVFEVDGVRYSHIFDPRTGRPVQGVLSVAVITDNGTDGDALDNVFYVLGPERSRELLNRFPAEEVIFFLPALTGSWRMERYKK